MVAPPAVYPINDESLLIGADQARDIGKQYATKYQSALPYPHICIDDFLPDAVLKHVLSDLKARPEAEDSFNRAQEFKKTSYPPERLPDYSKNLFYAFNSRPFILFLEQMTGINGLIPDPFFSGAGIHEVGNGGHLDIDADFNLHGKMQVERRLNVLIYLNPDWKESYGGLFAIWDKNMTGKVADFVPIFNRMVVFSTGSDTFHGNPTKVNHPEGRSRFSIALYYYTATWSEARKSHSTLFAPRPGTVDEVDTTARRREKLQEVLPPIVYRKVFGRLMRLGF